MGAELVAWYFLVLHFPACPFREGQWQNDGGVTWLGRKTGKREQSWLSDIFLSFIFLSAHSVVRAE